MICGVFESSGNSSTIIISFGERLFKLLRWSMIVVLEFGVYYG